MAKNDFIFLHHREEGKNISDFIERNYIVNVEPKDLLELNKDFIFEQMSNSDKKKEKEVNGKYPKTASDITLKTILPSPCILKVYSDKITAELAISQINAQVDTNDFYAFANEKIQSILQDEGYIIDDNTSKKEVDCQVFGWFKSSYWLSKNKNGINVLTPKETEFSDLSKYIVSLSTSVTDNGGSFTMKLPIISVNTHQTIMENLKNLGEYSGRKYHFKKNNSSFYSFNKDEYYSKAEVNESNFNFFEWLISSNDLLFISFERLKMEKLRANPDFNSSDSFDIKTKISEGVFDMIALVDDVKVTTNAQGEGYVEVSGRDLMKMLIEDGSFFFNSSVSSNSTNIFLNEDYGKRGDFRDIVEVGGNVNPINRLRTISGEIDVFANRLNMDIGFILKGVISQLTNIEVVPGNIFDSWGDDRTKFIELQPKKNK